VAVRTRYRSPGSVITGIAAIIAGIIVLGIVLVLADANQRNTLVDLVLDVGRFFTRPFRDLFPQDDPKQNVLVNWGIAALAYILLGAIIARVARRS
jgi:hypothetical protein